MAKKARTTRQDNFPNYMSWVVELSAADVFTTDKIFTPIPRNQVISGNKAVVMELLWLDVVIPNILLNAAAEFYEYGIVTGSVPTSAQWIGNGSVICASHVELHGLTTGLSMEFAPQGSRYDFQSKDGHGILLATDAFHAWGNGGATTVALTFNMRLYYRFVQIPVTEYIGIVQSQQSA